MLNYSQAIALIGMLTDTAQAQANRIAELEQMLEGLLAQAAPADAAVGAE